MREEGPWGPPAPPPPSTRLSLSLVVLLPLLLPLLLPWGAVSCSSSSSSCRWCQAREGGAEVARMGLAGDGSAETAHLSNSENGRFSYGVASSPGKRASMEDFYEARIDDVDGEKVGMFGVYDGHGGVRAAEYVKQNLFSNLIKHPKFISDTKAAIAETYSKTGSEFLKADSSQTRDAGSTASTAIIVGDRLFVANVGDSRAVISKGGQGKFIISNMTYISVSASTLPPVSETFKLLYAVYMDPQAYGSLRSLAAAQSRAHSGASAGQSCSASGPGSGRCGIQRLRLASGE